MKARRDAAVRSLKLTMVAGVALPLALFVYASWVSYHTAMRLADERVARSLDIVAEHALKVLQAVDVTFGAIEQITRGQSADELRSQSEVGTRLKQMAKTIPEIGMIAITNADGAPVASSADIPLGHISQVSDLTGVVHAPGTAGTTAIGALVAGRDGAYVFPVARDRTDSSGRFNGLTVMTLRVAEFESYFAQVARRSSASYSMIREDGVVLARYPQSSRPGIQLAPTSGFRRTVAADTQGGSYTTHSGVDDTERRFGIRKLAGYPLYVGASLQMAEIRHDWAWYMASHLIYGLPATIFMLAMLWLAMRRTDELYAEASRRQNAEASLRQAQKMEAIGQLTGGVAHDFNNLLTIIIGNLQLALRQKPEGKLARQLGDAISGAERAAQLTKRLLAFSRNQPLSPQRVDADALIAGMLDLMRRSLGERVVVQAARSTGLWLVLADPAELESAILNLAINARDAMKNGGTLTIETANVHLDAAFCARVEGLAPGEYVMIAVSDTGEGMSPAVQEKAFDPFFTTKAAGAGTGLGLSQVYGYVKQSGGHIEIESELDRGTSVKLYLPRARGERVQAQPDEERGVQRGHGERILVVEDEASVRRFVIAALSDLGYAVVEAENADDALRRLRQGIAGDIDLLLTDIVMPGMSGSRLAGEVIRNHPGLRVLFMTGYARDATLHQGQFEPDVQVIQKPIAIDALALAVARALASDTPRRRERDVG